MRLVYRSSQLNVSRISIWLGMGTHYIKQRLSKAQDGHYGMLGKSLNYWDDLRIPRPGNDIHTLRHGPAIAQSKVRGFSHFQFAWHIVPVRYIVT